ncbi:hypothetical protein B0H14DRAFT_2644232 [Mycena olivaceomarginata]|nr:hypothetical protein B0H14DRAFT_2644232 [Mycena olivaceomarginata]
MSSPPQGLSFEELLSNLSLGDTPTTSQSVPTPRHREREASTSLAPTQPHPVPRHHGQISVTTIIDWAPVPAVRPQANILVPGLALPHPHSVRHSYASDSTPERPTIYCYRTPTRSGLTTGWPEVNTTVNGFSNAIYRGYGSREEAEAAFAYALDHHWGSERLDWQVVFRGIKPGVYSSVIEAMLNTSGVPNAL